MFLAYSIIAAAAINQANLPAIYRSPSHGFSARLGDNVKVESKPLNWKTGQVFATVYSASRGPSYFQIAVTPIPESMRDNRSTSQILAAARDGTQTMDRLKIDAEQDLFVDGSPAKRFMVRIPDGPVTVQMIVLRGEHLIHILAVTPPDKTADGVAFVKSFQILNRN
ncbi:hypothetical protein QPK87_01605 [Kamptonema cortianum]|nr:hypothetical protein [Geitlerinema splendidum]MDK3155283.1 hypothetical protein [Kamptonema cortianum]